MKMYVLSFWFSTPEDGGIMFLQNVGIYLQVHTALQPRIPRYINELSLRLHVCFHRNYTPTLKL
jgi:hypothetical protein